MVVTPGGRKYFSFRRLLSVLTRRYNQLHPDQSPLPLLADPDPPTGPKAPRAPEPSFEELAFLSPGLRPVWRAPELNEVVSVEVCDGFTDEVAEWRQAHVIKRDVLSKRFTVCVHQPDGTPDVLFVEVRDHRAGADGS